MEELKQKLMGELSEAIDEVAEILGRGDENEIIGFITNQGFKTQKGDIGASFKLFTAVRLKELVEESEDGEK